MLLSTTGKKAPHVTMLETLVNDLYLIIDFKWESVNKISLIEAYAPEVHTYTIKNISLFT